MIGTILMLAMTICGIVISIAAMYKIWTDDDIYNDTIDKITTSLFPLVLALGLVSFNAIFITGAISLPYEYESCKDAINESKQILIELDDKNCSIGSGIGKGLEANDLKQRITKLIEKKAETKKDILTVQNNPFAPYKFIIEDYEVE